MNCACIQIPNSKPMYKQIISYANRVTAYSWMVETLKLLLLVSCIKEVEESIYYEVPYESIQIKKKYVGR